MIVDFNFESLPSYMNDVPEVIRAFSPYIILGEDGVSLEISVEEDEKENSNVEVYLKSDKLGSVYDSIKVTEKIGSLEYKRKAKRFVKQILYKFCNDLTGVNLPYGCLTGVRPTKLYYDSIGSYSNIKDHFERDFFVEPKRASLIENVVKGQVGIYSLKDREVDVFVNIPICPTRCKYCSFISTEYGRVKKLIPTYVNCVLEEIIQIKDRISKEELKVRSIYFGGGTPTALSANDLRRLCLPFKDFGVEFTVECGRPDSITKEKLDALQNCGVTRISVNPQTFKDETLEILGRAHSTKQLYEAYALAKNYNFDINMDLIAGLPNESFEDFENSLRKAVALKPENLTVHTLSLKRGSTLKLDGTEKIMDGSIRKMMDFSIDFLTENGYIPYYMYRQKNMADGLENVGWCLKGKQCVYNIDYMEETTTVLAAGAGAMSKFVYHDNGRIERSSNPKGFDEYLRRKNAM